MNHLPSCSRIPASRHRVRGFTLIEIMIVVVIIGVLSAIALPLYGDYVLRGRIPDATSNLSALAVRMEQSYQDNRTYKGTTGNDCIINVANLATSDSFDFSCSSSSAPTYTLVAKGKKTMVDFEYSINESGVKRTSKAKTGWPTSNTCWTTNKSGC